MGATEHATRSSAIVLGIDVGTTGTTVIAFDNTFRAVARAYRRTASRYPRPGWVEQDPEEVLTGIVDSVAEVLNHVGDTTVEAVGLAHQGESVVAMRASTNEALSPVLVWSDRRAASVVQDLDSATKERIQELSGLPASDYFSAAKIAWLLQNHAPVGAAAETGDLRFGNLDAWIRVRLGSGCFETDPSTASRTQCYNLAEGTWDAELTEIFGVRRYQLPQIKHSTGSLGSLGHARWQRDLPLRASLVDQIASMFGGACFDSGDMKITYGTGCFVYVNAGPTAPRSDAKLGASVAWSTDQETVYAVEGGVFTAGSALDWLVEVGILGSADESSSIAESIESTEVFFLPAFTGLGAPWWRTKARGAFSGITAGAGKAHLVRAVLDSIAFRVRDIAEAIWKSGVVRPQVISVDGGMTKNRYLMQRQSDLLGVPLLISMETEATCLGSAMLAAGRSGGASRTRTGTLVEPKLLKHERDREYARWVAWLEAVPDSPTA